MYILFDIGGTKMRVAASADHETLGEPVVLDTPTDDFNAGVSSVVAAAQKLSKGERIAGVVGGIRGPLNEEKNALLREKILIDWGGKPLAQKVSEMLLAPVVLENDAALGALGEATRGAGKGCHIVAYLTVSTGVGGARIVDGKIDEMSAGFEPGQQIIDADRTMAAAARGNTLEEMVSGAAIQRRFHKMPYDIPQEDPLWSELASWLAYGLKNTVVYWSPDVVVLGGSMMVGDPRIPLDYVERQLKDMLSASFAPPALKLAELGDFGGLHGALAFAKQRFG